MKAVFARINPGNLLHGLGVTEKWSLKGFFREKPVIAWLLVVAIIAIGYFRMVEPFLGFISNTEIESDRLSRAAEKQRTMLSREQQKLAFLIKGNEHFSSLITPLQKAAGEQTQINIIRQAALAQKLSQVKISEIKSITKGKVINRRFNLEARGSQAQLLKFIQELPNSSKKLFVTEVGLEQQSLNIEGNLLAQVIIDTFQKYEKRKWKES